MSKQTPLELHEVIKKLPKHLHKFVLKQPYNQYTPQNKAVWRYIMRIKVDYLSKVAHPSYIEGSKRTEISLKNIPRMDEANRILRKIGWAAIPGKGLITPKALMEFQAYNVLVIPTNIETISHIDYAPILDLFHESYKNTSILPDVEYSEYLRRFGEIGSKAISLPKDKQIAKTIKQLYLLKEDPNSPEEKIQEYEEKVTSLQNNIDEISEMMQISNLHWWTAEYGMIGTTEDPKIYGAALLSSAEENKACMLESVKKIPYSVAAAKVNFDETKGQNQLFVTPSFTYLNTVLEEFANTMAVRTGGTESINKLINSEKSGTIELSSGIQISGVFTNSIEDEKGNVVYVKTEGETALSYAGKELINHGISYHSEGFGCIIGKLNGFNKSIDHMTPSELETYGIFEGEHVTLDFEGGITIEGTILRGMRNFKGALMLISFKDCLVTSHDEVIFLPEWGVYDMAIGTEIVSGYPGVADISSFEEIEETNKHKIEFSQVDKNLHDLYEKVKHLREENLATDQSISEVFEVLIKDYSDEWLLSLELYEISKGTDFTVLPFILDHLESLKKQYKIHKINRRRFRFFSLRKQLLKLIKKNTVLLDI